MAAIAAIALSSAVGAETLPPGGKVNKAVTANMTPDGIDFLLDQGLTLLPDQIAIPDISGSQSCLFFSTLNSTVYQGDPGNGVTHKTKSSIFCNPARCASPAQMRSPRVTSR